LTAISRRFSQSPTRGATCGPAATGASSGRKPAKSIDDERVRDHLCDVVSGSVEKTMNAMLEPEAERLCNAGRYDDLAKVRGILTHGGFRLASCCNDKPNRTAGATSLAISLKIRYFICQMH
jgi:hypothetical protein